MKKLPTIDAMYWAMIVSATTIGETGGDLISTSLGLGYGWGTLVLLSLFVLACAVEVSFPRRHIALYWLVIMLASTAGTTVSDYLSRTLHLGYALDTGLLAAMLAGVFLLLKRLDRRTEGSLFGEFSRATEALYWLAILTSSTLGTAFGDLIANGTRLGFAGGTVLLAALLVVIAALERFTRTPKQLCYWLAIVVTHPIGATMGDYLTKPEGLGLGNVTATAVLVAIFAAISGLAFARRPVSG
ncbi:MAG: hypothetical protein EPO40_02565 [Myxococcaceae bacterium]|nr:MAG: hypothetical protein EPO40_02565 [Myxococcaceae bacterium]